MEYETAITLTDWRRQIAEMYAMVRAHPQPEDAWRLFRVRRDALFLSHPQTPLTVVQRAQFQALTYFPYDPTWRVVGEVETAVSQDAFQLDLPAEGIFRFTRIARVSFTVHSHAASLDVYWIDGYGGGIFLPFRDTSNGQESYGGGRYLYDTIKGADLSVTPNTFILDFNFAYNPSCAYNNQWVCPLAPPQNHLPFAVAAGEKLGTY